MEFVYDTEDEGNYVEEEVSVENKIYFPKFVITETSDDNVHDEFLDFTLFINMIFFLWILQKS